jgi:type II secretory pathway pseudopilin PulG
LSLNRRRQQLQENQHRKWLRHLQIQNLKLDNQKTRYFPPIRR